MRATSSCTTRACSAGISAFHVLSNWVSEAVTSAAPRSGRSLRSAFVTRVAALGVRSRRRISPVTASSTMPPGSGAARC